MAIQTLESSSRNLSLSPSLARRSESSSKNGEQKEAIEKGLITMQDVEMAAAEGTSEDTVDKAPKKFHMKKGGKLRIKRLKGKGKGRKKPSKPATGVVIDAMVA